MTTARRTRTSGQRRYLTANSAQTDFTTLTPVLTNGRRSDITLNGGDLYVAYGAALTATASPNWKIVQLDDFRGARIQLFGTGNEDSVPNYRIWTFRGAVPATAERPDPSMTGIASAATGLILPGEFSCFGYGTYTLSTVVGGASDIISASERVADAITFQLASAATSPRGKAGAYETAYGLGAATYYSPGNNEPAELIVPDFGGGITGFLIEFDMTANVTGCNALYELTR